MDHGDMGEWLWRNVALNGIVVGRVVDVILARKGGAVIGFEVRCEDGRHRYLPSAAAREDGLEIAIESPLSLLDSDQLDFYRSRGVPVRGAEEPAA